MSSFPNQGRNVLSADGAASPLAASNYFPITKTSAAAITLALPTADGQRCTFQDLTGHAHTVTTPASGVNGASHILTFGGAALQFVELIADNGTWNVLAQSGVTVS